MAYERSKSARDNFGKFINQLQPKTKALVRKLERILIKVYWQYVTSSFIQICLNEELLSNHTHTHTHTYIYIYIYTERGRLAPASLINISTHVACSTLTGYSVAPSCCCDLHQAKFTLINVYNIIFYAESPIRLFLCLSNLIFQDFYVPNSTPLNKMPYKVTLYAVF